MTPFIEHDIMPTPPIKWKYRVQYTRDGSNWHDTVDKQTLDAAITEAQCANRVNTKNPGEMIHRVIDIVTGTEVYRRGWCGAGTQ